MKTGLIFFLILSSIKVLADKLQERPIENRNLYAPNLFFLEPYPTTPITIGEKKYSFQTGLSISNMIDNNRAYGDSLGYKNFRPLFWDFISNEFYNGEKNLSSLYNSDFYFYGKLAEQRNVAIDLEVYRANAKISYGLAKNLELGFEITALSFNRGFLDKPIDFYHRITAVPYPVRDIYEDNKFDYQISDSSKIITKSKPRTGLGDSILDLKYLVLSEKTFIPSLAFVTTAKIPTGNFSYQMTNGKMDYSIGVSSMKKVNDFFLIVNLFAVTNSRFFKSENIKIVNSYQAAFTIGYHLTKKWAPIVQLEYKTSPYKTEISPLFQPAILISFGFNYKIKDSCSLRANVIEDPAQESRTVPDVGFQFNLFCIPETDKD